MKPISRPALPDVLILAAVALIWGSAFTAIKISVVDLGAMWAAAARVTIGFVSLLPFAVLFGKGFASAKSVFAQISVVALLNMVIPFILISWSMKHIEAGVGSLLLGTTPFIAMIMGHFLTNDERITPMRLLAVCFAMTGILILVGPQAVQGLGSSGFIAQLAIVISGACYVSAGFVMRKIDLEPIAFTTIALGVGSTLLVIFAFIGAGPPNLDIGQETMLALLWLGLLPTGLAYLLRFWLIKRVGVSIFALSMNTVPIFGIIIATWYLKEALEYSTLISLGFVLSGLAIAFYATPSKQG
jgi:drug/metabolite transporter (DMT)-like permease